MQQYREAPAHAEWLQGGDHQPATDRAVVSECPDANLGLACVQLVAFDEDAAGALADLDASGALIVKTGRVGGRHVMWLATRKNPAPHGQYPDRGFDVRGGGKGYVVGAPSLHATGRRYRVTQWPDDPREVPLLEGLREVPREWITLVEEAKERKRAAVGRCATRDTGSEGRTNDRDRASSYVRRAVEQELELLSVAAEGGRNDALNRAAFRLGRLAHAMTEPARIKNAMECVAHEIGLGEDEIRKTLQSGWNAGAEEPREVPVGANGHARVRSNALKRPALGGSDSAHRHVVPVPLPPEREFPGVRDLDTYGDLRRLEYLLGPDYLYIECVGWSRYRDGRYEVREDLEAVVKTKARLGLMGAAAWLVEQAEMELAKARTGIPDDINEASDEQRAALEAASQALAKARAAYRRSRAPGPVGSAVADFRNHVTVAPGAMDDPDHVRGLLVVGNGLLDLRTGLLASHDRSLRITKASPANWDPSAACPRWDAFLRDLFSNDGEVIRWHLAHAYLALCGDGDVSTASLLVGPGGGGRGTFMDALADVFGDYAYHASWPLIQARRSTGGHTDDLACARGCRLILLGETGDDLDLGRFKSLTGDKSMTVSFKGKSGFTMPRTWLLVMAGQGVPDIKGDTGARRRLVVTQTAQSFSEREADVDAGLAKRANTKLGRQLLAEREGILRSIVDARRYLEDGRLPRCRAIERDTAAHLEATGNPIREFLFLTIERGTPWNAETHNGAYVSKADLYRAYQVFANRELGGKALGSARFWTEVHRLAKTDTDVRVNLLNLKLGAHRDGLRTVRVRPQPGGKQVRVIPDFRLTDDGRELLAQEEGA